jgi:hypothetical protein
MGGVKVMNKDYKIIFDQLQTAVVEQNGIQNINMDDILLTNEEIENMQEYIKLANENENLITYTST